MPIDLSVVEAARNRRFALIAEIGEIDCNCEQEAELVVLGRILDHDPETKYSASVWQSLEECEHAIAAMQSAVGLPNGGES